MGSAKVLLPWQGRPLIRHVAEVALASRLAELIVVVGHQAEEVTAALHELPLRVVHNVDYRGGQSTSLRAGIAAVPDSAAAAVVLLADQPFVTTDVVDALITTFQVTSAPIVAACAAGRRGNPVLFARGLFPKLSTIGGDEGARGVIAAHRDQLRCVEVESSVFADIDTPDDYVALRRHE